MKFSPVFVRGAALVSLASGASAISLDVTSEDSIKSAAATIAYGMVQYYTGNNTGDVPGNLPDPYYWWEAGAFFGALVDYWYYTGDDTYNNITTQAIIHQAGTDADFMPANQTKTEGNDDQSFWALTAMAAAELKYPDPPDDEPQWLALAQAVFNLQANRWDDSTCGGGLRWQIYTFNNGYNYKNSISNGAFFNIGARLGKYTSNQTYLDWAEKTYDWVTEVGLMGSDYSVYDGTDDSENCTTIDEVKWTYNAGIFLHGAAVMWNVTQEDTWKTRTEGILNTTISSFFNNSIMYEAACEPSGNCDTDELSFKAYLSRWMAETAKVAPFTYDTIMTYLTASAEAAAAQCVGGDSGDACGEEWTNNGVYSGTTGVGQQMSALEVVQALLLDDVEGPVTNTTGGTSKGDSSAGSSGDTDPTALTAITTGDRVGAGFMTTFLLIGILGGASWMVM